VALEKWSLMIEIKRIIKYNSRRYDGYYAFTEHDIVDCAKEIHNYIIREMVKTAEKIRDNMNTGESRIWITKYIVELKKGFK